MTGDISGCIAVTGAGGFLGRRVVQALSERGSRVRAVVRRPEQARVVAPYRPEIAHADVTDPAALGEAFQGCTGLIHLAAILRERDGATYERVNHQGTQNVFRAAAEAGVGDAVQVSVIGASPSSQDPYLASRWGGEVTALGSGLRTRVVRFSVLFGEGDEFLNALAAFIRLGPVVPVAGNGRSKFQPIHVADAAECAVRAVEGGGEGGERAEVGGPEVLTYEGILDLVAEAMGARVLKVKIPIPLLLPAVRVMGRLLDTPPVTANQLRLLRLDNVAKGPFAEEPFGLTPRPIRGNIDYVRRLTFADAAKIALGRMPPHIRDH